MACAGGRRNAQKNEGRPTTESLLRAGSDGVCRGQTQRPEERKRTDDRVLVEGRVRWRVQGADATPRRTEADRRLRAC